MSKTKIIHPSEGKKVNPTPAENLIFKLTGEDTNGALDLVEGTIGYQAGPVMHIHQDQDEIFYILDGSLHWRIGEETLDTEAGDTVYVPRGVPHTYINLSEKPARAIAVFSPGGFDRFMDAWTALLATSPSPEEMGELAARYNQVAVGPPLAVAMGLNGK